MSARFVETEIEALPWDRDLLRLLASVAPDAWVTGGGHAYKPFFDGVYGPLVDSWDVDIRVWGKEREQEVVRRLHDCAPHIRWHVKDALSWARQAAGREVSCLEECFGAMCLICLCFGVQLRNNQIVINWGHPEAEQELRAGFLRPNPEGQIDFAPAKAKKIAAYYPGVHAPFIQQFPETEKPQ